MKPENRRQLGKGGMELVEEAIHLLRMAPGAALASYYIGSLPFILGLLYFWTDMCRSPFAAQHLVGGSLGLALLFLWMKFWQTVFASSLRARISGHSPPVWNFRRCLRVFIFQTAIQPTAVILYPLALLPAAIPLAWVYAFYQNVTALADGETDELGAALKRSSRQSMIWPVQNHLILLILMFFGFWVFLNLASVCLALPYLLKMLFGVESVYTQSLLSMLNTTFFAAMFSLTYLCVDPIIKAVYMLRCFYGESLQSGEDLRAELQAFSLPAGRIIASLLLIVSLLGAATSNAADAPPPQTQPPANVSPAKLDQAIDDVIHKTKYAWRMPRDKKVEEESAQEGPVGKFFSDIGKTIGKWFKSAGKWIKDMLEKWFGHRETNSETEKITAFHGMEFVRLLFIILLVLVVCGVAFLLFRAFRQRRRRPEAVSSEPILPAPDLADESVGAEQLPEDGWIKLGRELMERGELRLALRAFYFASLAHLSARSLITIARFKSNREYQRELDRRGHALPQLISQFGENVSVFDRSWYGTHEVNQQIILQFVSNVERIKGV